MFHQNYEIKKTFYIRPEKFTLIQKTTLFSKNLENFKQKIKKDSEKMINSTFISLEMAIIFTQKSKHGNSKTRHEGYV